MPTPKFTHEILAAAIAGFEQQKSQIDSKIAELKAMMASGRSAAPTTEKAPSSGPVAGTAKLPAKKTKRRLSPEGRRRIIEANKRMWEGRRTAEAKSPSGAAKKPTVAKKVASKKS